MIYLANTSGCVGKSTFVSKFEDAHPGNVMVFDSARSRDQFSMAQDSKEVQVVFWVLTRNDGEDVDYKSVESVKDGRFNNIKYHSKRVYLDVHPHCVILSNKVPEDMSRLTWSRWRLGVIESKESEIQWYRYSDDGTKIHMPGRLDLLTDHDDRDEITSGEEDNA